MFHVDTCSVSRGSPKWFRIPESVAALITLTALPPLSAPTTIPIINLLQHPDWSINNSQSATVPYRSYYLLLLVVDTTMPTSVHQPMDSALESAERKDVDGLPNAPLEATETARGAASENSEIADRPASSTAAPQASPGLLNTTTRNVSVTEVDTSHLLSRPTHGEAGLARGRTESSVNGFWFTPVEVPPPGVSLTHSIPTSYTVYLPTPEDRAVHKAMMEQNSKNMWEQGLADARRQGFERGQRHKMAVSRAWKGLSGWTLNVRSAVMAPVEKLGGPLTRPKHN